MTYRGFTLVEMVVTVAITTIVMAALGSLLVFFYRSNAWVLQQSSASAEARRGVDDVLQRIRGAQYATDGSAPVATASSLSIAFWADTNNDETLEQVSYVLADATLTRTVDGTSPVAIATSVRNTEDTPLFRYYDAGGAELTPPITLKNIASVRVSVTAQIDTLRGPTVTLWGQGTLRNKK